MGRQAAIFAVKPDFASALVSGAKRIEFRRVRPTLAQGDLVYVYSTAPVKGIVGTFVCGDIFEGSPDTIWRRFKRNAETTRALYREYFDGARRAIAIEVKEPTHWTRPLFLPAIRRRFPNFHPPRSYRFLASGDPLTRLIDGFPLNGGTTARKK